MAEVSDSPRVRAAYDAYRSASSRNATCRDRRGIRGPGHDRRIAIASAPCSFGVDEVVVDDAWMPVPDEMLDWMLGIGYVGTEMGPPGFLGAGRAARDRLDRRGLQLVGAFLPRHLSRAARAPADRDWLRCSCAPSRRNARRLTAVRCPV